MCKYKPLWGNIHKNERKFLVTKPDQIGDFICTLLKENEQYTEDSYNVEQFYIHGKKYRCISTQHELIYAKHEHTLDDKGYKEVNISVIKQEEFNSLRKLTEYASTKHRRTFYFPKHDLYFTLDTYKHPYEGLQLVEVWSLNETDPLSLQLPEWLVDVSNIISFRDKNLVKGSLNKTKVILEGTDFVGKTTLSKFLVTQSYWVQDRDMENISGLMLETVTLQARAEHMLNLKSNPFIAYIIMVNNDMDEIGRRMIERQKYEELSEFDKEANLYNLMYEETLMFMRCRNMYPSNLLRLDCTGKSIDEVKLKALELLTNGGIK